MKSKYFIFISLLLLLNFNSFAQSTRAIKSNLDTTDAYLVSIMYPVGSVFLSGQQGTVPPAQGMKLPNGDIIHWVQQAMTTGNILVTASPNGDWAVEAGKTAGTLQTTDPHQLTIAEMPKHTHTIPFNRLSEGGSGTPIFGFDSGIHITTAPASGDQPHSHGLTQLKRFGVIVWKRIE